MKIVCYGLDGFMEVIEQLVQRGLTFQADTATWTITLTGGY